MVVAVMKEIDSETKTVGHIPRIISALCFVFIRRGGTIKCIVNGSRRYSADLIQGGLEIPCLLIFCAKNVYEAQKTKELLESSLKLPVQPVDVIPEIIQGRETTVGLEQQSGQSQDSAEDERATKAVCGDPADSPQMSMDLTADERCSPPKKKQKCFDIENILLDCELSDIEVNHAQHLIKLQFSHLTGLQSTLLQEKLLTGTSEKSEFKNKLQIIFCKERKHWILATTIGCCNNEVKVYDSLYSFLDKDSLDIVENLFVCEGVKPVIKMARCQKQKGSKDCGVYAIANATALAFGTKLVFFQDTMRDHLINCFNKGKMSPFPCK